MLEVDDKYIDFVVNLLSNLKNNMVQNIKIETKNQEYELWSKEDLENISKVDLSTPLEDNEDYSKW